MNDHVIRRRNHIKVPGTPGGATVREGGVIFMTDSKFADEARKIHYGEAQERNIRGQVSVDESMALLDEGIAVVPLMVPAALKGSVH